MTEPDPLIHKAAEAVADGVPVDWDRAASRLGSPQRLLLDNLRQIRGLATPPRHDTRASAASAGTTPSTFVSLVAAVATLQIAIALFGFFAEPPDGSEIPAAWQLLLLGVFSVAGLGLLVGGHHDRRAVLLGTFYLVAATSFGQRFIGRVAGSPRPAWASVYLEALAPYLLWRFVQAFPRVERFSRIDRVASSAAALSLIVGGVLVAANLVSTISMNGGPLVEAFTRGRQSSNFYWASISILTLTALVVAPFRARTAPTAEKRRVAWFLMGIGFGLTPLLADTVLEVFVPWISTVVTPAMLAAGGYPFLATIPLTTAYAVMVQHVVEVSFVVRRTLQYALARTAVIGLTIVPVVLLIRSGLTYRDLTIAQLLELPAGRLLGGLAFGGVVLLLGRERLLASIDRAFRRNAPNPEKAIALVTGGIRDAADLRELADRMEPLLAEVLGASRSEILVLNRDSAAFEPVARDWRPLPGDCALVALVGDEDDAIDLGRDGRDGLFTVLPAADQGWLDDMSCAVIAPLRGRAGGLLGILALRMRAGGLPFTSADLALLRGLAGPIALVLDHLLERRGTAGSSDDQSPAAECAACGTVRAATAPPCECGGQVRSAAVPQVVAGKFAVERRLGAGAMGTAYLARDLTLHRPVVIKALPRRYAGATRRLEGEARAMARMSDGRLASIFGLETWQGAPLLVMEYLAGGTLADRLGKGRLPVEEALTIGSTLAKGLQVLHDNGLLHRDIKPSNIGFTGERAPKLLDFGLASLIDATEDPSELAGTPLYLAPELLAGDPPSRVSDLWSLAVVLFEAIAGRHPLPSSTVTRTLRAVASANIPALRVMNPDVPPPVDDLFGRLLARHPSKRPRSAAQMVEQLDRALHLVRSS